MLVTEKNLSIIIFIRLCQGRDNYNYFPVVVHMYSQSGTIKMEVQTL